MIDFITEYWAELLIATLAFAKVIVNLTPTESDNAVFGYSICLSLLLLATVVRSKMAKISSPNNEYPIKSNPASGDKVIGTDVSDGNATKNFTVGGIASFTSIRLTVMW